MCLGPNNSQVIEKSIRLINAGRGMRYDPSTNTFYEKNGRPILRNSSPRSQNGEFHPGKDFIKTPQGWVDPDTRIGHDWMGFPVEAPKKEEEGGFIYGLFHNFMGID